MAAKDQRQDGTSNQDRAAAALRENLRKRKAQQRERAGKTEPTADERCEKDEARGQ